MTDEGTGRDDAKLNDDASTVGSMTPQDRGLPNNPRAFIQACVRSRRILWTYHVNMRLHGRFIPRRLILDAVDTYEIIEEYPKDKYLPSYLVLVRQGADSLHVLFAIDTEENNVRIVTAYRPDLDEWEADLKTRRIRS